jgi:integrase
MDSASRRRPHEVGEGAQNGIFCRVGYLLANAWQTSAGVGAWEQLSPHSLRHSAITFADPDLPVERTMRPGRST